MGDYSNSVSSNSALRKSQIFGCYQSLGVLNLDDYCSSLFVQLEVAELGELRQLLINTISVQTFYPLTEVGTVPEWP